MTFQEFWPEYVRAHSQSSTRILHCIGTLLGWITLGAVLALHRWWWIPLALVIPYALAWISHFFIEHNKPATFKHPLWSLAADYKMFGMMLAGRMGQAEIERCRQRSAAQRPH